MTQLTNYAIEAKLDGINWTDITADVIGDISGFYGIADGSPTARVADSGELRFTLNNGNSNSAGVAGYYSPDNINRRSGFNIGLPIRLSVTYDGQTKTRGYGKIPRDGIKLAGSHYKPVVDVTVRDFMYWAGEHELTTPAFAQNKRIDEVVALIVANMTENPVATDYRTGNMTFPSVFDTVRSKTRALTEFGKVALSELGYIYPTHKTDDEVLRVEGLYTRNGEVSTNTKLPISSSEAGRLLKSDGDYLLKSDGDKIILSQLEEVEIDNSMTDIMADYGSLIYNRIKLTCYPRKVDSSAVVLFELQKTILINAGETINIEGRYKDPDNATNNVSGTDMVAPVASTDYLMNAQEDGGGADLTANLSVTPTYGVGRVIYALENTGGVNGYITLLQARGKGVYLYDPVDVISEDEDSINQYGLSQLSIDMKYQDNPVDLINYATVLLDRYKNPITTLRKITMIGNRSDTLMKGFVFIEPGDRLPIKESVTGLTGDYYIQGVEYRIKVGGLVQYGWYLRPTGYDNYNFAVWNTDKWDDGTTWGF